MENIKLLQNKYTMKTKNSEEETNTEGGQEDFLNENEDLDYLNDTFKSLKIKELEYVRSLLDATLSEKRARFRMNKSKLVEDGVIPESSKSKDSWEARQEAEDDYV